MRAAAAENCYPTLTVGWERRSAPGFALKSLLYWTPTSLLRLLYNGPSRPPSGDVYGRLTFGLRSTLAPASLLPAARDLPPRVAGTEAARARESVRQSAP